MQIGMIGLGRMGMNMAIRLLRGRHGVVAFNRTPEKIREIARQGAAAAFTLEELVSALKSPRIAWIMLPAGKPTDDMIDSLLPRLKKGDMIIDGSNGFYKDDIRRAEKLKIAGISYVDAGVSGGIWGLKAGYCLMVGGEKAVCKKLEPIFRTLAPKDGYLYCGPAGAGHFVKMVHNGIEYGMMSAYGEGFGILDASPYSKHLDFGEVAHLWNQGSVVRSWLLELAEKAFNKDKRLSKLEAYVEDSGEGRWTVQQAIETAVPAPVITAALFQRFSSRDANAFSDRMLAALRNEFGGHTVKQKKGRGKG
ncbi:MAG: decarboxylating 6-phosphogluconate dehydrogenase [Nitrospirae bacterium]|nr:decarboxylating 6-phosphogluconate dehydrogenase [Nitrospirota bacterium]